MVRWMIAATVLVSLSGCGASDENRDVGGVTAGEARALNEAAAMLDKQADNARSVLGAGSDAPQQ